MLKELDIENLAIIKKSNIEFNKGFNVITGETGAGKSMVLNALSLILGERASQDLITTGESECKIQAIFDLQNISREVFESLPDIAKENELVINRVIGKEKSKIYINGMLSNLATLESVTSKIISFCGQNQQMGLLNSQCHLEVLDTFSDIKELKAKYKAKFLEYKKLKNELKDFKEKKAERVLRLQELMAIKADLESINMKEPRKENLENELRKIADMEQIQEAYSEISDLLFENTGLFSVSEEILKRISKITRLDREAEKLYTEFSDLIGMMSEFENNYNLYKLSFNVDSNEVEKLREELSNIVTLERKYATNEAGLLALYQKIQSEISSLSYVDNIEVLEANVELKKQEVEEFATKISKIRKDNARILSKNIERELVDLNLPDAKFLVLFNKTEVDENGIDSVEFQVSLNKGYEARALKKVASGGELSRILLVLKKIIKDKFDVNVLIFDEVDSGMSGKSARAVGNKLKDLSLNSQIICITHLPQVASLADAHYVVSKSGKDKVYSHIKKINSKEQVEEIARMLSGFEITQSAKVSAKELIAS